MKFNTREYCRLCCGNLHTLFDIGMMSLTGIFPSSIDEYVPTLPLCISKCDKCELIQLKHDFDISKLYGDTYGYRSGLNNSMVEHLKNVVEYIKNKITINDNITIIDIGSNDGTLLNNYNINKDNIQYIGVDPTSLKYKEFFNKNINIIGDFFSEKIVRSNTSFLNVKIITTISMFYDLPNPLNFVTDIYNLLDNDGLWFTEQSYFLSMINNKSFDTICQEHIEYYCLKQIKYMSDIVGFKIIDVGFNDINGGSFYTLLCKKENNNFKECSELIEKIITDENIFFKDNIIEKFDNDINNIKFEIFEFFDNVKKNGLKVHGYGASTKGNVLLQYFNITNEHLEYINEINEYKFNRYTPGTLIKIISNEQSKNINPDYYFVLPWHFKKNIIKNELKYIENGGKLIFPLPNFVIIDKNNYKNHII